MVQRISNRFVLALAAVGVFALLFTVACAPPTPEERVQELRDQYEVEVSSYIARDVFPQAPEGPQADAEPVEELEDEVEEELQEEVEGVDIDTEIAVEPIRTDAHLDLLVTRETGEGLDGLTVDVWQGDAEGNDKEHWRIYLDVSEVPPGPGTQMLYVLEDVQVEENDGFYAEVVETVPAEERDQYREFQEAVDSDG